MKTSKYRCSWEFWEVFVNGTGLSGTVFRMLLCVNTCEYLLTSCNIVP